MARIPSTSAQRCCRRRGRVWGKARLAVAAAIALFGFQSGAALATVVGVLIEVPVMLLVVKIVNRSKGWYEAGLQPR